MTSTIITKNSSTASSVPLAASLTAGELAINTADKRLFSKNGSTVFEVGTNPSALTLPNGTANGVPYLNGSKVLTSGSALVFDGTNLGIGTSSPTEKLHVAGAIRATGAVTANATGGILAYQGSSTVMLGSWGADASTYGAIQFYQANSTGTGNRTGMLLDASGNLGLGVTPSAWSATSYKTFEIGSIGNAINSGTNDVLITANAYFNSGWKYGSSGSQASFYNQNAGTHIWKTAPSGTAGNAITFTQAMTLDASGNLLVGTTSAAGKITIAQTASSAVGLGVDVQVTSTKFCNFTYQGSVVGSISYNGTLTVYATTSDYRLKNVIGPVSDSGQRIDALEPIEYEWKSDGSRTRGFLAHKFQEVYAGSVIGTKDSVDAERNPVYQAIQAGSSEVIADLVAEIQSLRKRLAIAGI